MAAAVSDISSVVGLPELKGNEQAKEVSRIITTVKRIRYFPRISFSW